MKGLNNPGNIRVGAGKFLGEIPSTGAFRNFSSLAYGYRAIMRIFLSYRSKGFNTLRKALYRYAPPSDSNPTLDYVNYIAKALSFPADADLSPILDSTRITELAKAISTFEQGKGFVNDPSQALQAFNMVAPGSSPSSLPNGTNLAVIAGISVLFILAINT